jgi:hypothetical protein
MPNTPAFAGLYTTEHEAEELIEHVLGENVPVSLLPHKTVPPGGLPKLDKLAVQLVLEPTTVGAGEHEIESEPFVGRV